MDPLSALGIAGNIVQFIDFSCKLISTGQKIHGSASGALVENLEIEAIAKSIQDLNSKVDESLGTISRLPKLVVTRRRKDKDIIREEERIKSAIEANNTSIREVCKQCSNIGEELLEALQGIKAQGSNKKWNSFRAALKSVWGERKVEELFRRMERLRDQLDSAILVSIRQKIDDYQRQNSEVTGRVEDIMKSTNSIEDTLLGHMQQSKKWQAEIISAIYQSRWHAQNQDHVLDFSSKLSGMAKAQRDDELKLKLLQSLKFPGINDRRARIAQAHQRTFEWLYHDPKEGQMPWGNFVKWLEGDSDSDNIYWITGKPGSGKSTLMKWLANESRTWQHLRVWTKISPLITAGFFFWNSGNEMQMSRDGLLLTLLFNCLSQIKYLVPIVFPERWQSCQLFGEDFHPWDWEELSAALRILVKEATKTNKLFFIIDGLDEFNGDHDDLVIFIQDLSKNEGIKLCIASRPWLVFEDAFGQIPNLMLQNLTYPDIEIFVNSRLCENPRFCELQRREPSYSEDLIEQITTKSAGVFLWITLVVRSLLSGLANSDRLSDLSRRVALMPVDLEDLYTNILRSLDRFYLDHASQLFQLVRASSVPLSLLELSFADEEDPQFAIEAEIKSSTSDEELYRCEAMKRRLISRCKGLLEVPMPQNNQENQRALQIQAGTHLSDGLTEPALQPSTSLLSQPGSTRASSLCFTEDFDCLKVQYLHRTVKDFFETPDVWLMILSANQSYFDPNASLGRGFLLRLKNHNEDRITEQDSNMWRAVECCWKYASLAEMKLPGSQTTVFQELERVASHFDLSPNGSDSVISSIKKVELINKPSALLQCLNSSQSPVNGLTTTQGQTKYLPFEYQCAVYTEVKSQLEGGYLITQDAAGVPLLTLAILGFQTFSTLRVRLIKVLLKYGASVNQKYQRELGVYHDERHQCREITPWQDLIAGAVIDSEQYTNPDYNTIMGRWVELAKLFIANGARCEINLKDQSVQCIRSGFWRWSPGEARELESLIIGKASNASKRGSLKNVKLPRIFSRKGDRSSKDKGFSWRGLSVSSKK